MKVLLDKDNYIIGYATFGDIVGSIEVDVEIPDDFEIGMFKIEKNKLIKDEIKLKEIEKIEKEKELFNKFLEDKTKKDFENWKKQL